jgi:hypothetical protein
MNIIQISEQLKDVPDQFLMQEIQNPTGSYPSYLVVSELTRRKRMRDGAIKQEPTTSVAEDLVGISSGTPRGGTVHPWCGTANDGPAHARNGCKRTRNGYESNAYDG